MNGTVTVVVECENSACPYARQPVEVELRAWGHAVEWPTLRCMGCEFVLPMPPVPSLADNDPVPGRDYDPMPGEHYKRCPCKWCHPCVNCGLPISSNRNGYYHAPGRGQGDTGCADPVPSNMQRYEPTRLPLRNDQHAFEQAAAMVKVCVCGKWPMHHAHLGISAESCTCDGCRSRRPASQNAG